MPRPKICDCVLNDESTTQATGPMQASATSARKQAAAAAAEQAQGHQKSRSPIRNTRRTATIATSPSAMSRTPTAFA